MKGNKDDRKTEWKKKKDFTSIDWDMLVMAVVICCLYFSEKQIQRMMQKRLCAKVIKYEDELLEIVMNLDDGQRLYIQKKDEDDSNEYFKTIYYKDLEDEKVDRMFRTFRLIMVTNSGYSRDGSVEFYIDPTIISVLWDDYMYGFYYTENDESVDVVWTNEIEETEFEHTVDEGIGTGRKRLRTTGGIMNVNGYGFTRWDAENENKILNKFNICDKLHKK